MILSASKEIEAYRQTMNQMNSPAPSRKEEYMTIALAAPQPQASQASIYAPASAWSYTSHHQFNDRTLAALLPCPKGSLIMEQGTLRVHGMIFLSDLKRSLDRGSDRTVAFSLACLVC